jgi:hypothetical protein
MTIGPLPVCFQCQRLQIFPHCTAFGDKVIPHEIATSMHDHSVPVEGDNGRLFVQANAEQRAAIKARHREAAGQPAQDAMDIAIDDFWRSRR